MKVFARGGTVGEAGLTPAVAQKHIAGKKVFIGGEAGLTPAVAQKHIAGKKVFIGGDHGGYALKTAIVKKYKNFIDCGNTVNDPDDDFPDYAKAVCNAVLSDTGSCGILVCGTGIGVSICANRFRGIRAALCHSVAYAELARQHNNANVLCLGGRFTGEKTALDIVDAFLHTEPDDNPKYKKRMEAADGTVS
jgi:ribose 5-phosphate isomerase B